MTTRPVRLEESTIASLEAEGKAIQKEMGIQDPSYSQIIDYLIKKTKKK